MNTKTSAILTLAVLVAGACSSPRPPGEPLRATPGATERGGEFASGLELRNIRSLRDADDLLCVQFELHNKQTTQLAFEWAVEWRDTSNSVVETPRDFRPLVLGVAAFEELVVTAPTSTASMWKLAFHPGEQRR